MHSDKENRWVVNIVKNLGVVGEGVSQRLSLSEKDEEQVLLGNYSLAICFLKPPYNMLMRIFSMVRKANSMVHQKH